VIKKFVGIAICLLFIISIGIYINGKRISTACYSYEIKKVKKDRKYYLDVGTGDKILCTEKEYNQINKNKKHTLYGIEYKKNELLYKLIGTEPKLISIDED